MEAIAKGKLPGSHIFIHLLADIARNVFYKPGGWRHSDIVLEFCGYIYLLSCRGYRGLRGGEGAGTKDDDNLPITAFNIPIAHSGTVRKYLKRTDSGDSNFTTGISDGNISAFFIRALEVSTNPVLVIRQADDDTHVRLGVVAAHCEMHNMEDYDGCP